MLSISSVCMILISACIMLGQAGWANTQASNLEVKAGSQLLNWGSRCTPSEIRRLTAINAVKGPERWGMKYPPFWDT